MFFYGGRTSEKFGVQVWFPNLLWMRWGYQTGLEVLRGHLCSQYCSLQDIKGRNTQKGSFIFDYKKRWLPEVVITLSTLFHSHFVHTTKNKNHNTRQLRKGAHQTDKCERYLGDLEWGFWLIQKSQCLGLFSEKKGQDHYILSCFSSLRNTAKKKFPCILTN